MTYFIQTYLTKKKVFYFVKYNDFVMKQVYFERMYSFKNKRKTFKKTIKGKEIEDF